MLVNLEAGDKLLQTVYLSRYFFALPYSSICGNYLFLHFSKSNIYYFSKFSKEKEDREDISEDEKEDGEKEKSGKSMKEVNFQTLVRVKAIMTFYAK